MHIRGHSNFQWLILAGLFVVVLLIVQLVEAEALVLRTSVGYVLLGPGQAAEDSAALRWLRSAGGFDVRIVRGTEDLQRQPAGTVLWFHGAGAEGYRAFAEVESNRAILRKLVSKGVRILCTDYAAALPFDAGVEPRRPSVRLDTLKDDWLFDKKGFQSWRGHPIFDGLFGGEYVWDGTADRVLPFVEYGDALFPEKGKVLGVEKSYVFLRADRKEVIEHRAGTTHILSVGGAVYFGWPNTLRANLEKFIENCILYLGGAKSATPATAWEPHRNIPRSFKPSSEPLKLSEERPLRADAGSGLLMTRSKGEGQSFDLAGRRALVMGKETGGIDEIWVHPIRVLRDFETGVIAGDTVVWLKNVPAAVEVRPESFARTYDVAGGKIRELLFASYLQPGAVVRYETTAPVRLVIRFRSDLRWMWPYDANALGDLYYGFDEGLRAIHVRDSSGTFVCLMGGDRRPSKHFEGHASRAEWNGGAFAAVPTAANEVAAGFQYDVAPGPRSGLTFVIVGTNEGSAAAVGSFRRLMNDPSLAFSEIAGHYRDLLENRTTIDSPDREFNEQYRWALVGTDRFVAKTPGVGEGLLAGFATTARGWDGEQSISGRPGYAWYFGRDASWSGLAVDGYGDFEVVRQQLEFFQSYQDLTGKIFHELSTSGVVHFDAADATPLYVILAAHYLRASGDVEFIRKSWPHLQKAMRFLYSTDTDGDGLIENTNVGHGWIEGGKLFGAHTTFYLACLWAQTLNDAAAMAQLAGDAKEAERFAADGRKVRGMLNREFWNEKGNFYYYGKWKGGSMNPEPTVLPAVGMLFNLLDEEKAASCLRAYAGNGFTTDWGVRILSGESPMFNPRGYHQGSVWPLFTGWTALAEYTYGRSTQAYSHVASTMQIGTQWSLGFIEEVMHGSVYTPSGVCPHQCWSETSILHPLLEGMVGWKPDAPKRSALLAPRFPIQWDTVTVKNLRIGGSLITLTMKRSPRATIYRFSLRQGPQCVVRFTPEFPPATEIQGVLINDRRIGGTFTKTVRGLLASPVTFTLDRSTTVQFNHWGGIAPFTTIPRCAPGDSAVGFRLVDASVGGAQLVITAEGKPGTTTLLPVALFSMPFPNVPGVERTDNPGIVLVRIPFEQSTKPYVQHRMVIDLK